jgi:hypothetical protein
MVYDRTCRGRLFGLSSAWAAGAWLYRTRGLLDGWLGAASWMEAFAWLSRFEPEREIAEIQFWGHGKWGDARIGSERLSEESLRRNHPHATQLQRVRERLAPEALFWFRTCETIGAHRGRQFARQMAEQLACRVAGHTYVIDVWQSGLHALSPGQEPYWPAEEGLREGDGASPREALRSGPAEPNTISCLDGVLPDWA